MILIFSIIVSIASSIFMLSIVALNGRNGEMEGPFKYASRLYLRQVQASQTKKFGAKLPQVLSLMTNALKAGLGLQQCFILIANEGPHPANKEFQKIISDVQIGLSFEEALQKSLSRISSDDWQIVIDSITTLKKTGGNLIETFSLIVETIHSRQKVENKIDVLTAQGRFQAAILSTLGPAILIILYIIAPDFIAPLFDTKIGNIMLLISFVMQLTAFALIKRIISIRV